MRLVRQLTREECFLIAGNEFHHYHLKNEMRRWIGSFVELGSGFGAKLPFRQHWTLLVDRCLIALRAEVLEAQIGLEKFVARVDRSLCRIVLRCDHAGPFLRNFDMVARDGDLNIVVLETFVGLGIALEPEPEPELYSC